MAWGLGTIASVLGLTYGKYGGQSYTNGVIDIKGEQIPGQVDPIDDLDKKFMHHDLNYRISDVLNLPHEKVLADAELANEISNMSLEKKGIFGVLAGFVFGFLTGFQEKTPSYVSRAYKNGEEDLNYFDKVAEKNLAEKENHQRHERTTNNPDPEPDPEYGERPGYGQYGGRNSSVVDNNSQVNNNNDSENNSNHDDSDGNSNGQPSGGGNGDNDGFPIILDLNFDGKLDIAKLTDSSVFFDLKNDGFKHNIAWVGKNDGFLITDLDGNGKLNLSDELFIANQTSDNDTDMQAFAKLYDSNHDGKFNIQDSKFNQVYIFQDINQNGVQDDGELFSLNQKGITEIDLTLTTKNQAIDNSGTIITNTANFIKTDGTRGLVGDVALGTAEVGYRMNSVTDGIEIRTNDNIKAFIATNDLAGVHINAQIAGYDVIYGGRAHDDLSAGASNTNSVILLGGEGNDIITGGLGDDYLIGDAGADIINGGAGHDVIFMDKSDKINGGEMYDVAIVASADGVVLNMGATNIEAFIGNIGNDTINASTMVKGDTEYTAIIQSSEGNDTIIGSNYNDLIVAGAGYDVINAGAGDDVLVVDTNDNFQGGDGFDTIYLSGNGDLNMNISNYGIEILYSGDGNDILSTNNDKWAAIFGGGGNDAINGGWGNDDLAGDKGNDILNGGYGSDSYYFSRGDGQDIIKDEYIDKGSYYQWQQQTIGSGENQRVEWFQVRVDYSNDIAAGDSDIIKFGADIKLTDLSVKWVGNDLVIGINEVGKNFDALSDKITIKNMNAQNRQIEYMQFADGTKLNLNGALLANGVLNNGAIVDFSKNGANNYIGTIYNDILGNGELSGTMQGGAGDDIFLASGGADRMIGGAGNDGVNYGNSAIGIRVNFQSNIGTDNDDIASTTSYALGDSYDGIENISATRYDDIILGNGAVNNIFASDGNDLLEGGAGADVLNGGAGYDAVIFASATSAIKVDLANMGLNIGDASGDVFQEIEAVYGSKFNDSLYGDAQNNDMRGFDGNDVIETRAGNDKLNGGAGNDSLRGGLGDDVYFLNRGDGIDNIEDNGTALETRYRTENYNYTTTETYYVNRGEGSGWVTRNVVKSATREVAYQVAVDTDAGQDSIKFGDNIKIQDVYLELTNGGTKLSVGIVNDASFIVNNWQNTKQKIEFIEFNDGTKFNIQAILNKQSSGKIMLSAVIGALDDTIRGTAGNDIIVGGGAVDIIYGGAGDDKLFGGAGNDRLFGEDGNDVLEGGTGADYIDGGNGNDTASYESSGQGVEVSLLTGLGKGGDAEGDILTNIENLVGSKANDKLTGNSLANSILAGLGNDYLDGGAGNDYLDGGQGNDELIGGTGADTLIGGDGNDTASYKNSSAGVSVSLESGRGYGGDAEGDVLIGIENLTGSQLNDTLNGDAQNNILDGQAGIDKLVAGIGDDSIFGGAGSDSMEGGVGNDLYIFSRGDANETIFDYYQTLENKTRSEAYSVLVNNRISYHQGEGEYLYVDNYVWQTAYRNVNYQEWVEQDAGIDTMQFGAGITTADVLVMQSGGDLIIGIKDVNNPNLNASQVSDKITLKEWFSDSKNRVEYLQFADGTKMGVGEIIGFFTTQSNDNITWQQTYLNINGFAGNDTITSGEYNDILNGGDGNDALITNGGDDILMGGKGNDSLNGGAGNDTYYLNAGDGVDIVYDTSGVNKFVLDAYYKNAYMLLQSSNLQVFYGNNDSFTIQNYLANRNNTQFQYSDGAQISEILSVLGTANSESLNGTIYDDYLVAGAGNDTINGGSGKDTYRFNYGDGTDIIYDFYQTLETFTKSEAYTYQVANNRWIARGEGEGYYQTYYTNQTAYRNVNYQQWIEQDGGQDTIMFGADITRDKLRGYQQANCDLVIKVLNANGAETSDQITLKEWFSDSKNRIEFVQFSDGTKINASGLYNSLASNNNDNLYWVDSSANLHGFGGNDTITTGGYDDIIRGGTGNDIITAGAGNDSIYFGKGDGQDLIKNTGIDAQSTDKIIFDANIDKNNLWFWQSGNNLTIGISQNNDKITLENWYSAGVNAQVDEFVLNDGLKITKSEVQNLVVAMNQYHGTINDAQNLNANDALKVIINNSWHL